MLSTNIQLIFLTLILVVLLISTFWLFRVKRTDDYATLFLKLRNEKPNVQAFCLGYDMERGLYHNVSLVDGETLEFKDQYDPYPMDLNGRLDVNQNQSHGRISDQQNGFTISGMGLSTESSGNGGTLVECPDGFFGPTCQLAPLCEAGVDDDKYYPITTEQFNNLSLFNMQIATPISRAAALRRRMFRSTDNSYHPRIRVHCLANATRDNSYELQVCPENKLLDFNTLKCVPYDVCSDMINGSKHHYEIDATGESAEALKDPKVYYLCDKKRSILQKCSDDTAFSVQQMACVNQSRCFGKPNGYTFARDQKSFVRCENDVETLVECRDSGVVGDTETGLKCRVNLCRPGYETRQDGILEYRWRERLCNEKTDTPYYNTCTTKFDNTMTIERDLEWNKKFNIELKNWPDKILLKQQGGYTCKDTFSLNDVLTTRSDDPTINVSWGDAWKEPAPFSIKKRRFTCCNQGDYKFGWDLLRLETDKNMSESARLVHCSDFKTVVDRSNSFYDTAFPCANAPIKFGRNNFNYRFDLPSSQTWYHPNKNFPLLIGLKHNYPQSLLGTDTFWPNYIKNNDIIAYYVLLLDQTKSFYTITHVSTSVPPDGFTLTPNYSLLSLKGMTYPVIDLTYKYFWLCVYSGMLNVPNIPSGSTTKTIAKIYDMPMNSTPITFTVSEETSTSYWRIDEEKLQELNGQQRTVCETPLITRNGLVLQNKNTNEQSTIYHYNIFYCRLNATNRADDVTRFRIYYAGLEFNVNDGTVLTF